MKISDFEKRNYVLKDKRDLIILSKIKKLEKGKLSKKDKEMVKLIRSQLKRNWRLPLVKQLDKISKNNKTLK